MKLRIDPEKICFRLDFEELERLLERGDIQQDTDLPEGHLTYKVICLPQGFAATFQANATTYCLSLASDIIENHKATLPSLNGIVSDFPTQNGGTVTVALEINLKKKLKHALDT